MTEQETRAGFGAVIGAPNAGKSTLVNALVGQKVAIVSPKAQTTRSRLMGIAIHDKSQILLVDTPGIFEPRRRLDRAMVAAAWTGAQDADLILLVIDSSQEVRDELLEGLEERFDVEVVPTYATLRPGHRLRVTIDTTDFPHLLPTPLQLAKLYGGVYDVLRTSAASSSITVPLR